MAKFTGEKELAFKLWNQNPQITGAELEQALKKEGFEVAKSTSATWLARFKKLELKKLKAILYERLSQLDGPGLKLMGHFVDYLIEKRHLEGTR